MSRLPGIAAGSACWPHVRPALLPGCPCAVGEAGLPLGPWQGCSGRSAPEVILQSGTEGPWLPASCAACYWLRGLWGAHCLLLWWAATPLGAREPWEMLVGAAASGCMGIGDRSHREHPGYPGWVAQDLQGNPRLCPCSVEPLWTGCCGLCAPQLPAPSMGVPASPWGGNGSL